MLQKDQLPAAIDVPFCGYQLQSPFILASGPLTHNGEGMIRGYQSGFGAVVTKTIRLKPAVNPTRNMARIGHTSQMNCEKWSDIDRLSWYEKEIPDAVRAGAIVIASVGSTADEVREIAGNVEQAGAHMLELASYNEGDMLPMLEEAKKCCHIPILCKISANWPDPVKVAQACYERGASGISAIDSIGPGLKIDIQKRRPAMLSEDGYGWVTGEAIRPISLRINAEIARTIPGYRNLYGIGGVMQADDALEYLMAGCQAVGVCTACIIKGIGYITQLCYALSKRLDALGFSCAQEAIGLALANFPQEETVCSLQFDFDPAACTKCGRCEQVCCYQARKLTQSGMYFNEAACRNCGLCTEYCPTGALTASP